MSELLCILILEVALFYLGHRTFKLHIYPKLLEKSTKIIEKNPKWIVDKIQTNYYGFQDIDIIIAESAIGALPRFRLSKENRFELLISDDFTTKDVDEIATLAILGKLKVKYNLFYPDKPLHWLSILCFMLDGGDIKQMPVNNNE